MYNWHETLPYKYIEEKDIYIIEDPKSIFLRPSIISISSKNDAENIVISFKLEATELDDEYNSF